MYSGIRSHYSPADNLAETLLLLLQVFVRDAIFGERDVLFWCNGIIGEANNNSCFGVCVCVCVCVRRDE